MRAPDVAQPVAEVDVLDRRMRVARLVEAADRQEIAASTAPSPVQKVSDRPAPSRCTWWWRRLRNAETVVRVAGVSSYAP